MRLFILVNCKLHALVIALVFIWATVLSSVGSQIVWAAAGGSASWKRVPLSNSTPEWISSAEWATAIGKIVVVDPFKKELSLISPEGTITKCSGPEFNNVDKLQPLAITRIGDEFALKLSGSRMVRLDSKLRPLSDLVLTGNRQEGGIGSLYQWVSDGKMIFGYGPVFQKGEEDFSVGFFRSSRVKPTNPTFFAEFDESDYYVLGFPYIATMGSSFFYVEMRNNSVPVIVKVEAGAKKASPFTAFPKDFDKALAIQTSMDGSRTVAQLFRELEGYRIPAGLYSQGGYLFLLTRTPMSNEGTLWDLHKINPSGRGTVIGSMRLPTTTNFLSVVVSDKNWYFIERREVKDGSRQEIPSMLVISTESIQNLRSLPVNPQG